MEELFKQREDEEKEGEEEKGQQAVPEKEKKERQVKLDTMQRAEEEQEVYMEDKHENSQEMIADKEEDKERKGVEERDDKKKSRKRRGKKQSERGKNRKGLKDASEPCEEKSQIPEVSAVSSEESSALSEPPIGLMNSCDLSDPVYMGCGGTGLYCPPVPVPLLYSSQPPVPIQPLPPQPQGTKRPHSPLLPPGLPQLGPQPLEVRKDCH